jgi:hypothetical protein
MRNAFLHFRVAFAGVVFALVCGSGFWLQSLDPIIGPEDPAISASSMSPADLESAIDKRLAASKRRAQIRKRIAQEFIAGQITFMQAAEQYRDLNEARIDFSPELFSIQYGRGDEDECVCLQVINWVRAELRETPTPEGAFVEGLEQELAALIRNGKAKLPR